ncbi:TerB N-terminal domain-containing protein [Falsiroseomonas sp.]|uniref:tellurite resistance TerB family protein n=1 Tax=Falsiroseomonas sp. TaxID=2870721 RepID=UPI003F712B8A
MVEVFLFIGVPLLVLFLISRGRKRSASVVASTPEPVRSPRPTGFNPPSSGSTASLGSPRGGASNAKSGEGIDTVRFVPLDDVALPPASRRAAPSPPSQAWVPPGQATKIADVTIPGGMVYVGLELAVPGRYGTDNCLINPRLSVARSVGAGEPLGLHYWPDYASITPAARRAYLTWLAGGRRDPAVDIGLVFLFFYGLERRVFLERSLAEAPALVSEVERLVGIYGGNASFSAYATEFLAAATVMTGRMPLRVEPQPIPGFRSEIPFATRVHLGAALADGRPLAADDALLWVLGVPETSLRTPGQRCFAELRQLFGIRFAERHPRGLAVSAPKRRLSATYHAASGTFTVEIPGAHTVLPDVTALSAPLRGLGAMLEACQVELEAYSRLLGRKPEARGALQAALLLPGPLRDDAVRAALGPVRARVTTLLASDGPGVVGVKALLAALDVQVPDAAKLSASIMNQVGQRLDALGFGMEPDRRYGGAAVASDGQVVLFAAAGGAPVDPERPPFVAAKAAMEVAMLAAVADGELGADEFEALLADARAMAGLEPAERLRLDALVWTLREQARPTAALKRAAALPEAERRVIAAAAVSAILADGVASPREVAFLERVHRSLGLPVEAVHATLHKGAGPRPKPSATVPAAASAAGANPVLGLDAERMERIRQETTAVSALLSDIFSDDDEETPIAAPASDPEERPAFEGLDAAHGRLLLALLATGRISAEDFEREAKASRLMPEGAAETINDWGFDRFGEPVIELDDGGAAVPDHLLDELRKAGGER